MPCPLEPPQRIGSRHLKEGHLSCQSLPGIRSNYRVCRAADSSCPGDSCLTRFTPVRLILCTDGDFNVGVTNQGDLIRLIEQKAKEGVFLTCLGYG